MVLSPTVRHLVIEQMCYRAQGWRNQTSELTVALAKRTLGAMDQPALHGLGCAWRWAVETWLRRQRLIEFSINGKSRYLVFRI